MSIKDAAGRGPWQVLRLMPHLLKFRDLVKTADQARDRLDYDKAISHYRAALNIYGSHAGIWVQLGNMLKDNGQYAASEDAYHEALRLRPDNSDTFLQLGHLMNQSGRSREAVGFYERAVEADRSNAYAFKALAAVSGTSNVLRGKPGVISMQEQIELDELIGALKRHRSEDFAFFQHSAFRRNER